jgi:hypothetical protein
VMDKIIMREREERERERFTCNNVLRVFCHWLVVLKWIYIMNITTPCYFLEYIAAPLGSKHFPQRLLIYLDTKSLDEK